MECDHDNFFRALRRLAFIRRLRVLRRMMNNAAEFERMIDAIVVRFFAQNSRPSPSIADRTRFALQVRELVGERGLPPPLAAQERGAPGGMTDEECAPLIARVMAGLDDSLLAEIARQLVKACFYPEFKTCRDSFREVAPDGSCRRQQLPRVRARVSGAHCVDCPHWVALSPTQHAAYLTREWHGDRADFAAHRDVFLPEDFRTLRRWLYAAARA